MSWRAVEWVLDHATTRDSTEQMVLVAIAEQSFDDGMGARPSIARLARRCRMSRRSVQRALKKLCSRGVLLKTGRWKHGEYCFGIVGCQSVSPDDSSSPTQSHPQGDSVTPGGRHHDTGRGVTPSPDPSVPSRTSTPSEGEVFRALWNAIETNPKATDSDLELLARQHLPDWSAINVRLLVDKVISQRASMPRTAGGRASGRDFRNGRETASA